MNKVISAESKSALSLFSVNCVCGSAYDRYPAAMVPELILSDDDGISFSNPYAIVFKIIATEGEMTYSFKYNK